MKKPIISAAIIALIVSTISFAADTEKANLKATIKKLETSNVNKDVEKAIKQGDWRFIGVNGYTTIIPGTEDKDAKTIKKFGVRVIEGTSDFVENDDIRRLNTIGRKYATEYNRALLQKINAK